MIKTILSVISLLLVLYVLWELGKAWALAGGKEAGKTLHRIITKEKR